ncbi:hypothetical protein CXF72_00670 [Psychromonas sp. MB-3u-54]|uniref:hypothetical protein n=1 Tax=Psychromonas sp. MB-3u-54 TaxID=2058319 RepID=UPI000C33CF0E|nr:hypothetical protein [Psychromonas sp. MB-3u-54]PKH04430.1 hypothetical protein CXF72_00670 [Psychromonas sp. MB-3u-54]
MEVTTKKAERAEAETKEEQRILSSNAWHLARYVIEHDYEIIIPEEINIGQFLCWSEDYPKLKPEEKISFINQYALLEKITKSVTARTLVATRIHGRGFFHAVFCTSVGKYLLFLSTITLIFVCLLIVNLTNLLEINKIIIPFCAAGLGTCVFLLRVTQERLTTREFDPAFIPSQLIRLGLGVLAGGTIVLFPGLLRSGESVLGTGNGIGIELGSLAFVLGYAVDIFYALLDNIGGRIKDKNK